MRRIVGPAIDRDNTKMHAIWNDYLVSASPDVGERAKIVLCGYPIPCNFGKAGFLTFPGAR